MATFRKLSIVLAFSFLTIAVAAGLIHNAGREIHNTGRIIVVGLEIYQDEQKTLPLTEINWGELAPGARATFTAYAVNNGTTTTILTLAVSDWQPPVAAQYLTLSWNYVNGTISAPQETTTVIFQLAVSPQTQDVTTFNFTATITAAAV